MRGRTAALPFAFAIVGFAGAVAMRARATIQTLAADQQLSAEERARLLAKGKELFIAHCARCHGENGDGPLRTGGPLSARELSSDVIARAVKGHLRDGTDEERRAVTLYISSLMKTKDSEQKAPPKP